MGDIREINHTYRIEPRNYGAISVQPRKHRDQKPTKDQESKDQVEIDSPIVEEENDIVITLVNENADDLPHLDISA